MHITNVLFNLLDNAVKYRRLEVPLTLMCRTWNENGKLLISIEDNGIGSRKNTSRKYSTASSACRQETYTT